MSASMSVLKLLWPFLKEMLLGDKTVGEALKTNKMRVLLLFLILGSFGMNLLVAPRLYAISSQYIELEREHKQLLGAGESTKGLQEKVDQLEGELVVAKKTIAKEDSDLAEARKQVKTLTDKLLDMVNNPPPCKPFTPVPKEPVKDRRNLLREQLEKMRKEEDG